MLKPSCTNNLPSYAMCELCFTCECIFALKYNWYLDWSVDSRVWVFGIWQYQRKSSAIWRYCVELFWRVSRAHGFHSEFMRRWGYFYFFNLFNLYLIYLTKNSSTSMVPYGDTRKHKVVVSFDVSVGLLCLMGFKVWLFLSIETKTQSTGFLTWERSYRRQMLTP